MIPISVCIIAKNESDKIEGCLRAIRKHPFEIIVIDTGSTDDTIALAEKYADRVISYTWDDNFSNARNFAAENASNDWILAIDCDEQIQNMQFQQIQDLIKQCPDQLGCIARRNLQGNLAPNQQPTMESVERLYNRTLFHYVGAIHEQLARIEGNEPIKSYPLPLEVIHTGFLNKSETQEEFLKRETIRLQTAITRQPDNAHLYYELGKIFYSQENYEDAYKSFDHAFNLKINSKDEYVQHMIIFYGYSMLQTNRVEKATFLSNVYDQFNHIADFVYLMGTIYMQARITDKALIEFLRATTTKKYFTEGTNSYLAYYSLGEIYEVYGNKDEAKRYYTKCGNYQPALDKLTELNTEKNEE